MVLDSLRRAFLERKLKRVRGPQKENYLREIERINAKEKFEAQVKETQTKAYREEELRQAARLGSETAKIQTQRKLDQIRKTGGSSGFMAGLDKFLAGTGVAKGTAKVVGPGFGGTGGVSQPKFDIMGGGASRPGGFNVVRGYPSSQPAPITRKLRRRRSRARYKTVRVRI